jgi:hypothetical protein
LPEAYDLISREPEDVYLTAGWGVFFAALSGLWLWLGIRFLRGLGLGAGSLSWLVRVVFGVVLVVFTIIAVTQPIDRAFAVGIVFLAGVSLLGVLFVSSKRESGI